MTITFFINYLNHHQLPVADELYQLLGNNFHFVATFIRDPKELKGGIDYSNRPYCLLPAERDQDRFMAHELNISSDVCVFGAGNIEWERERSVTGKLSFEISERWFKRGWFNLCSPRLLSWLWFYHTCIRDKPFYKLCAGAFTASDCKKLLTFKNKCYKWGYFTKVKSLVPSSGNKQQSKIQMLWSSRFITWKHPEMVVALAYKLKNKGYDFNIEMIGDGPLLKQIIRVIHRSNLEDVISIHTSLPNEILLTKMAAADIFLFTSDSNEGWGVVANEAMSQRCVLVASNEIGSTPYLIEDGISGFIFQSNNIKSLYEKVKFLFDNPERIGIIAENGYNCISTIWSPKTAVSNLLQLIDDLSLGKDTSIIQGPCSKA